MSIHHLNFKLTAFHVILAICIANRAHADLPAEIAIGNSAVAPLSQAEAVAVRNSIDRGISYLRKTQTQSGSWVNGPVTVKPNTTPGRGKTNYTIGYAALPALALIEGGVGIMDPNVQAAVKFVRTHQASLYRTYDLALSILLLDRAGEVADRDLIISLGHRLAAGQNQLGGWSYNCPILNSTQQKKLAASFAELAKSRENKPSEQVEPTPIPPKLAAADRSDHSNTQFAILGLSAARRHDDSFSIPLELTELRFRSVAREAGWAYDFQPLKPYGAMTAAGVLALGVGRGTRIDPRKDLERSEDKILKWGLEQLSRYMDDPTDDPLPASLGPRGLINPYFLWSVERVGVLCRLKTIGGKDWYRWGMKLLVNTQKPDGSWLGRGSAGSPIADTSFAILFLGKSDFLPDVAKTLAKRVKIVDPGPPDLKAGIVKEGKIDPKKAILKPKEEKTPSSAEQGLPSASLGKVRAGEAMELPLKVRGPESFRILKIEGTDAQVKIDFDRKSREFHELAVTVKAAEPGELRRTLTLTTDLPDLREVEVRIIVQVDAGKSP